MVTKILLSVSSFGSEEAVSVFPVAYLIGAIIAALLMGYLIYVLIHPEKF